MLSLLKRCLGLRDSIEATSSPSQAGNGAPIVAVEEPASQPATEVESTVVAFDDREVYCTFKTNLSETGSVKWRELREVGIVVTDDGPFTEDLYWILIGDTTSCIVPGQAVGCNRLLARLQRLPGFDNVEVIRAMSSSGRARFVCWRRGG